MNITPDNRYTRALQAFLPAIGFSPDRVQAVNITDGRIEVALNNLPHGDPALASRTTISIDYTKERP